MAKIWYSVAGEGMGHAIRSETIISELVKDHDVLITSADKAYHYLQTKFPNVYMITSHSFVYRNNRVAPVLSLLRWLWQLPKQAICYFKTVLPLVRKFKPDVIVSDLESHAFYAARKLNVPCVSVDNNHSLTRTKHGMRLRWYLRFVWHVLYPKATKTIILSIVPAKGTDTSVSIVDPILRKKVTTLVPSTMSHVLVYQTTDTNTALIPVLQSSKREFRVYGMNRGNQKQGNVQFKTFNESQFLSDLASCEYVIINGGFTVLSEALFLKKPIISITIHGQDEQELNAYLINKHNLGMTTLALTLKQLQDFERDLAQFSSVTSKLNLQPQKALKKVIKAITGLTK